MAARGILDNIPRAQRLVRNFVAYKAGLLHCLVKGRGQEELGAAVNSAVGPAGIVHMAGLPASLQERQALQFCVLAVGVCLYNHAEGRYTDALPPWTAAEVEGQARDLLSNILRTKQQLRLAAPAQLEAPHHIASAERARSSPPQAFSLQQMLSQKAPVQGIAEWEGEAAGGRSGQEGLGEAARLQLSAYLRSVEKTVADVKEAVEMRGRKQEEALHRLQALVANQKAVEKQQVYPVFMEAGGLYLQLQQQAEQLQLADERLAFLTDRLGNLGSSPKCSSKTVLPQDDLGVFKEDEGPSKGSQVALGGFCPVSLAAAEPRLVPRVPDTREVVWEGKVYLCSSAAAAEAFEKAAGQILESVLALSGQHPALITLLDLQHVFFPNASLSHLVKKMEGLHIRCHSGVQTETHPVLCILDRQHEWNGWALRKRALAAANLQHKHTSSVQTSASHFRRETTSQVWLPKTSITQTPVGRGQSMPQALRHIVGARGHPGSPVRFVNVVLDLGQPEHP
eukprot:jgi/Botrbrau1/4412/Bobra.0348s0005.2